MKLRKLLCVVLSICMVLSIAPLAYAMDWDSECKTDCGGDCGTSPLIIVPGIMQSQVYVQDENGKDLLTSDGFPIVEGMDLAFMFDTIALENSFKEKIGDILGAVALHNRDKLLDILLGVLDEGFASHYFNPDGTRVNDVAVDEYWYSLEKCKTKPEKSYNYAKGYSKDENGNVLPTTKYENEYDFIKRQVNMEEFCEEYGYDHTYYYSYSYFGDVISAAEKLDEYVQMVKAQTGHDKVSICFISLGGTIGNVYLAEYCDPDDIDRVVFAAAAVDGSYLLADLMAGNTTFSDGNALYNDLVPNIINLAAEEYLALGYFLNPVVRAIPQEFFSDFLEETLDRAIDEVLGKLLYNCPSMWALVPSAVYPEMSAKLISDAEHAALKEKTDRYYNIQKNAGATLKKLSDEGMNIFVISGYNLELPAAVGHYKLSSDNIIQSSSTSIGGTFADVGSVLSKDYKPAIDSSYISPDGIVDAGTCALPDNTWFVKNQSHLTLQASVNDIIGMCVELVTNDEITDARVNNGGYPQFLEYRNLKTIEDMIRRYEEADLDSLDADKRAAVDTGYEKALALLEDKSWTEAETLETEEEFYKAMSEAGLLSDSADSPFVKYQLMPVLLKITKFLAEVNKFFFRDHDIWLLPCSLL